MGAQKKDSGKPNYDEDAYDDESPVHEVKLSKYRISRYLVTVAEYLCFINDDGYKNKACWKAGGFGEFETPEDWEKQLVYPNRPVVGVSWYEAMAYAYWAGMDLPTEAQWERAARGKGKTYRKFPWGNNWMDGKVVNSGYSGIGHPSPVGMFPDDYTEEGVLDMGGNVWEWCRDWFNESDFYKTSTDSIDPVNDEKGVWGKVGDSEYRVVRGGSWPQLFGFSCCSFRPVSIW